jgi:hypothetical protein
MIVNNSCAGTEQSSQASSQWASYAKAAGLGAFALGVASSADAAVIVNGGTYNGATPVFPLVINPVSYTGANQFNIDGAGLADLSLGTGGYGTAFARDTQAGYVAGKVFTAGHPADYAQAFAAGSTIDSSATVASNFYGAQVLSKPSFSAPSFLGFQTTEGYFGWMQLSLTPRPGDGLIVITIDGWAIQDSGAPIQAGVSTDIPEPNCLALLAAGSVGILARRRLKKAA